MFNLQGENKREKTSEDKEETVNNKEVIAEYDEVLKGENAKRDKGLGGFDALRERLGLSGGGSSSSQIKTNLIDNDSVATFVDWKSNISFFISYFLVFLIIISGALAYIAFLEKEKKQNMVIIDEDIKLIKKNITKEEELVELGLSFQEKVDALSYLLDNHVYWTNFFEYMEKNTLEEVNYSGFSGGMTGEYSLKAKARETFFTASEQIKSFEEDEMTQDVKYTSLAAGEDENGDTVNYSLDLEINTEIFYKE
jgi:hypothetical protein